MKLLDKIRKMMVPFTQSGTFIKTDAGYQKVSDDWFKTTVKGSGLDYWGLHDEEVVYAEPVFEKMKLMESERPLVVVDKELAEVKQEVLKFVSYFDISPNGYETFSKEVVDNEKRNDVFVAHFDISVEVNMWDKFLKEHERIVPGLNPYTWTSLCKNYEKRLLKDKRLKKTNRHQLALVCTRYSFLYQYYLIPSEAIKGRVRYVIDEQ